MLASLGAASLWEQRALQQAFSGAAALMDPATGEVGDSLRTLRPLTRPQGCPYNGMFRWHQPHITPNCKGRMLPVATRSLSPPPATIVKVTSGLPHWATPMRGAGRGRGFLPRPNHWVGLWGVGISKYTSYPESCWKGSIRFGPQGPRDFYKPGHISCLAENVPCVPYHPK